jgi:hypothetical protein
VVAALRGASLIRGAPEPGIRHRESRDALACAPRETAARDVLLTGAVVAGVLVASITELLSLVRGLTAIGLVTAWGLMLIGVGLVARRARYPPMPRPFRALRHLGWSLDLAMLAWIAVVILATGAIAVFAVPITVDSMTYHLARVAHWVQQASVAFYPTHVIRQIHQPPWAEYAVLHLFLLWGGDRLSNLVQWGSMILSLVGVSVIARQLGAGTRGQLLGAFVCATIPMGIMQAGTVQNDYAVTLWLVCLASALLALRARPGLAPALVAGGSLGLALLTKATAYVFAAPLVALLLLADRRRPIATRLGQAALIGLAAIALNAPQYARNLGVFGSPLGPGTEGSGYHYVNDAVSPAILASNVVRNVGLHAGTPWPGVNAQMNTLVVAMHRAMGIAIDDPRTTWPAARFTVDRPVVHEDLAGNVLHAAAMAVAFVGAWRVRRDGRVRMLAVCLLAAFVLFCLLLRWQPWHSRLHLPLFVLASPVVGVVFERLTWPVLAISLALLGVSSVPFLAGNDAHPLLGRRSIFTRSWAEQRPRHAGTMFVTAASMIRSSGCAHVGLAPFPDDREYFLWALLADGAWRGRLEPVLVTNASAVVRRVPGGRPCAIIRRWEADEEHTRGVTIETQQYRAASSRDGVELLLPVP